MPMSWIEIKDRALTFSREWCTRPQKIAKQLSYAVCASSSGTSVGFFSFSFAASFPQKLEP